MAIKGALFITVPVFLFVVVLAVYFFLIRGASVTGPASYAVSDAQKPRVEVAEDSRDLGPMKVSDEKSADFTVKNTGAKPLQLSDIQSSCMCTAAQIIYNGKSSEEFGMHSQSGAVAEIAPGQSAVVRVIYRPYQMPVYGYVEREVYVTTNDPLNSKLVFKVTASVS
ncbi:MAG: DUF1573 domain-containing protein [Patescibacteria group bacterium]|nr:DUF1573 domain-containing protein [Patescibacteria group bacterium]